jgi:hypothetical protein
MSWCNEAVCCSYAGLIMVGLTLVLSADSWWKNKKFKPKKLCVSSDHLHNWNIQLELQPSLQDHNSNESPLTWFSLDALLCRTSWSMFTRGGFSLNTMCSVSSAYEFRIKCQKPNKRMHRRTLIPSTSHLALSAGGVVFSYGKFGCLMLFAAPYSCYWRTSRFCLRKCLSYYTAIELWSVTKFWERIFKRGHQLPSIWKFPAGETNNVSYRGQSAARTAFSLRSSCRRDKKLTKRRRCILWCAFESV